jgi:hypothetical protein
MPFIDSASTEAVVLITGGSAGAGRKIARELARRGDTIVLVYLLDQAEAEAAVEEILTANGTAVAVRADPADELDVERLFTEATVVFGRVDVVVHTQARAAAVIDRHAARRVRRGGAIIHTTGAHTFAPVLADELRARAITVNGLTPGTEPPGAGHAIAGVIALVERWRHTRPGERPCLPTAWSAGPAVAEPSRPSAPRRGCSDDEEEDVED